jgi:hypothetical protein
MDLRDAGYTAPAVTHHLEPTPRFPDDLQLYVRMCSRFEDLYSTRLSPSLNFFWPRHDLLAVLDSDSEADRYVEVALHFCEPLRAATQSRLRVGVWGRQGVGTPLARVRCQGSLSGALRLRREAL